MNFVEKAAQKHKTYTEAGYCCSDIKNEESFSSFESMKDGLTRLHKFTESEVSIEVAQVNSTVNVIEPEIKVEVVAEVVVKMPIKELPKKKTTTKKKGS